MTVLSLGTLHTAGGAETHTPRKANSLHPTHTSHEFPAPKPIPAPNALIRARQQCHNTNTVETCLRGQLRHAYAAIAWQRKQNLALAREMLGNVTAWTCIHQGEGAWNDTADPYWGGLQMDRAFMRQYGRDMLARHHGGLADQWTPREQIIVAQRAFSQNRGYAPWPQTSRKCGLR